MNTLPGPPARTRHGPWNRWPVTTTAALGGLTALAVLLASGAAAPEPVPLALAAQDELDPPAPTRPHAEPDTKADAKVADPEVVARQAGILGVMASERG